VWVAIVSNTGAAANQTDALWYGYPPWIVVLVGTVVAVALLWLFSKILKWALLLAIVAVLVGGLIWAAKLYLS
jgi:hypothetical protein